jgi:hypothetical protein
MEREPLKRQPSYAGRFVAVTSALLLGALVLLWLVWGFRWPSTAQVVAGNDAPDPGRIEEPAPPPAPAP